MILNIIMESLVEIKQSCLFRVSKCHQYIAVNSRTQSVSIHCELHTNGAIMYPNTFRQKIHNQKGQDSGFQFVEVFHPDF